MLCAPVSAIDFSEQGRRHDGRESLRISWQHEWEVHHRRLNKQRLKRRAVFALALLAEPLQLQWAEVLLDTTFLAWKEAIDETRRRKAQPAEQRQLEEALESAAASQRTFLTPRTLAASEAVPDETLSALHGMRAGILLADHGTLRISGKRLEMFLRDLDDTLTFKDVQQLVSLLPSGQDGSISVNELVCFLLGISSQQLASVLERWHEQHISWQHDFEIHNREQKQRQLRRRAVLALALLAEPLQKQWTEALTDIVFSSWSDYVADDHRTWALSGPRRLFERSAKARAASHRIVSFQVLSEVPEERLSAAVQEAQRTVSRHGSKSLSQDQFQALLGHVAPRMEQKQMQVLLENVPRSHGGGIPIDGLMGWIFGATAQDYGTAERMCHHPEFKIGCGADLEPSDASSQ